MNAILGRLGRMLTNRMLNWGTRKGIDKAARMSGGTTADGKMTPAAQKQAKAAREAVKRARQAARITRRMR
ncbi:hypothetical protein [Paracoccus luteus]|uniref:hypothetical protein n=1 Tax=Paracoccus luteus TaxID=2508543 RepID=UPI00106F466B|nr:hypothetical protein [Paracoccus luteus]